MSPTIFPWWEWWLGTVAAVLLSIVNAVLADKYGHKWANVIAVTLGILSLVFVVIGAVLAIIWASHG